MLPKKMKAAVVREFGITGWETLCEAQQNGGYSVNGSYAEYVIAGTIGGRVVMEIKQ